MRIAHTDGVAGLLAARLRATAGAVLVAVAFGALAAATPAIGAPSGAWLVQSVVAPSNIPPGGEGTITVEVENVGDAPVSGTGVPVTVRDALPAGLEVSEISGVAGVFGIHGGMACSAAEASCTWSEEPLQPYEALVMTLSVKAAAGAVSGVSQVSVSGGGLAGVSVHRPVGVSGTPVPFGAEDYALSAEDEGGLAATQAGAHPFQLTTALVLHQTAQREQPPAPLRNLGIALPAGLTGDPTQIPQCSMVKFLTFTGIDNTCSSDSAIGVAYVHLEAANLDIRFAVPVFNLPPAGEPARFGFVALGVPVTLDVSLRTGGDYGVTVTSRNTSQIAELVSADVTLWGVPADPRHDASRGWGCVDSGLFAEEGVTPPCTPLGASRLAPFLTLPTSCTGPLASTATLTPWPTFANPEGLGPAPFAGEPLPGMEGCDRVPFAPELSVAPDVSSGGSPSGLGVDVRLPSLEGADGLAEGDLKKAVVTLPQGVVVNPAAANGLGACSQAQIGLSNANPASCPDAAKVGTVEAVSPALKAPLVGSVYVAQQGNNPFGSLLALYLALEGEGVLVKLAGEVRLDPVTGQVTTVFDNVPQQPISDIRLHLFGGPQAALSLPPACGSYTSSSQLMPYSSLTAAEPSSAFQVTSGAGGSGCAAQTFSPSFTAGTVNNQAGAFSPLSVTFSRSDQDQTLDAITLKTPPGLLGILKSVPLCGEPQASQGACGQQSLIGHATVLAGAGPDPISVGGQVFLTGPYAGKPFGLSIVVPAIAGPFNLGTVVARAGIAVDPHTTSLTVSSDPLPSILQGIPLDVRTVNVTVDRPGFIFNPTDCEPLSVGGTITSTQGASVAVSSRFQAANCAALPFHPVFSAGSLAKTSRQEGAALDVKVAYPQGSQANIHSVAVTLPKQLPARLSTIQQACPEAVFNANPAGCDAGSLIGTGTAQTPIFNNPITGPAYLVSHGGAAFPDVDLVLQGEGVTVLLVGHVSITKSGITSATFGEIPDAPISAFELNLPEGPHSGLSAVGSLCTEPLVMPTTITGQNGAVIKQNTRIKVTGCTATKKKAKKHRKTKRRHKKHRARKGRKG